MDPKDLPITRHSILLIITKVSAPSWRSPSLSFIVSELLLYAPSSSYVTTSITSQGDLTSFYLILLPLHWVSSLDSSFPALCLFDDLSSSMLLSGTNISLAHPSDLVFFLSILDLTTCSSPLTLVSLFIYLTCLLRSTLLLLFSSRSILSHLISFSSPIFPSPPPSA
jgi:hypothetical protein